MLLSLGARGSCAIVLAAIGVFREPDWALVPRLLGGH